MNQRGEFRMSLRFVVAGLLLGAAAQPGLAAPSFSKDVIPLLKTRCAVCHLTGSEAGKMGLAPAAAYGNLVNVKSIEATGMMRVVPGKPDDSYLVAKLEGKHIAKGGIGARMPFGAPPLPQEQIDMIRDWIKAGAKKD